MEPIVISVSIMLKYLSVKDDFSTLILFFINLNKILVI